MNLIWKSLVKPHIDRDYNELERLEEIQKTLVTQFYENIIICLEMFLNLMNLKC